MIGTGPGPDGPGLRVLTQNLWAHSRWPERRFALEQGVRDLAPGLAAFQEAVVIADADQVREVSGAEGHVLHGSIRQADGSGISIASRWPIEASHELDLRPLGDQRRFEDEQPFPASLLAVEVDVPGPIGRVLFANANPSWGLDEEISRERQAVACARFLAEVAGDREVHVIVAGDFDADGAAASLRFWTGRQSLEGLSVCYRDAWESAHPGEPGHTFTPEHPYVRNDAPDWPWRRLDHVLVRCGRHAGSTLAIERCELAFDQPIDGVWGSDHLGLIVDLAAR